MSVLITSTPFDPEAAHLDFRKSAGNVGAITAFTGLVRGDRDIVLSLSHYAGMTETEITKIGEAAAARWPITSWRIIHRVGDLQAGEPIVFVAAASAHRRASFEAADFLMDYLKSEAPFWKQETHNHTSQWIEPRAQDKDDIARWQKPIKQKD